VDVIDDVLLPELNSQEFIFDTHEYRRWHRIFDFKYDAAASVINAKCRNYSTKLMPFEMTTADDLKHKMIWIYPPTDKINSILNHFETLRQENPDSIAAVIILPCIVSAGTEYKSLLNKYKKIHTYPKGTYLLHKYNADTLDYEAVSPIDTEYDVYLAASTENENIPTSSYYTINIDEHYEHIRKPHQPRFETPLYQTTSSSVSEDLLILNTPIVKGDKYAQSLIDSGATLDFISKDYVRELKLPTHRLKHTLRVRLADGSLSLTKLGVMLTIKIGTEHIEREFVLTKLTGSHQMILGLKFLKDYNPDINWTNGTLCIPTSTDEVTIHAIVQKRTVESAFVSAKQMARMMVQDQKRREKSRKELCTGRFESEPSSVFYICAMKEIMDIDYDIKYSNSVDINAIQGYDESTEVEEKIREIKTDFNDEISDKLKEVLSKHEKALKPLLGLPVQRPDFDFRIEHDGPIPNSKVYRMSPAELEELQRQLKDT